MYCSFPDPCAERTPEEWAGLPGLAFLCLHHPLEGLALSRGAAAVTGSSSDRKDALHGMPIEVSFDGQANLLPSSPLEEWVLLGSFYC